ncbi:MAG: YfhO family protein [Crocinitomicaceae bacterium]|nr:YfhO family protein [Crocinitomicaceae bacterium]
MKWDAMDLYLPWKFFITESLKDGYLPLWNFSLNGGFPQMGDPGTWYPISWLIGWITNGYSIMSVHIEYLFHLFIAGIGMFFLIHQKINKSSIALVIACSYLFSGVFISNAQHIGWIVGAAWFPWVLFFFNLWIKGERFSSFSLALVLFFQLSGGYPALFFITIYILLFLFITNIVKTSNKLEVFYPLNKLLLFGIVFLSLSAIVISSSFDMAQHINRGANVVDASGQWNYLVGSLSYNSFLTFIFPLSSLKELDTFWKQDSSMISVFIGFFVFVALLSQLITKKPNKSVVKYVVIGLFFFSCTLGYDLPVRSWIAKLPLLDMFRFPSVFRLFGDFYFILAAAFALNDIVNNQSAAKRFIYWIIGVGVIFAGMFVFYLPRIERWRFIDLFKNGYINFLESSGFNELIVLQLIIFIILIASLIISYFYFKKSFFYVLFIVCVVDISSVVWLQRYGTVFSDKSVKFASKGLENSPKHFPIPELKPMYQFNNDVYQHNFNYLWKNLPIFSKKPSNDGSSPYVLLTQGKAYIKGYDTVFNKYPLFFMNYSENENVINFQLDSELVVKNVNPNYFKLKSVAKQNGFIVFNHNYYPHWKARVDEKEVKITRIKENYMSIPVKRGRHVVEFQFEPPRIKFYWYLFIIGLLGSIIGSLIFIGFKYKKK